MILHFGPFQAVGENLSQTPFYGWYITHSSTFNNVTNDISHIIATASVCSSSVALQSTVILAHKCWPTKNQSNETNEKYTRAAKIDRSSDSITAQWASTYRDSLSSYWSLIDWTIFFALSISLQFDRKWWFRLQFSFARKCRVTRNVTVYMKLTMENSFFFNL